jgi:hypothetical protein
MRTPWPHSVFICFDDSSSQYLSSIKHKIRVTTSNAPHLILDFISTSTLTWKQLCENYGDTCIATIPPGCITWGHACGWADVLELDKNQCTNPETNTHVASPARGDPSRVTTTPFSIHVSALIHDKHGSYTCLTLLKNSIAIALPQPSRNHGTCLHLRWCRHLEQAGQTPNMVLLRHAFTGTTVVLRRRS